MSTSTPVGAIYEVIAKTLSRSGNPVHITGHSRRTFRRGGSALPPVRKEFVQLFDESEKRMSKLDQVMGQPDQVVS
jgi:hypothetical protein